ncbi:hypothetical protein AVEN_110546-1 [Araneus ventricosus]|uniref:Uncharacterized protein n=1 Tax=Araneus ventricosus TaxID=182803 RepID=A0A4Y2H1A9_ARAVE|nr:hypothetical protein AVEN_110546-1 [Araneus ventricosus]
MAEVEVEWKEAEIQRARALQQQLGCPRDVPGRFQHSMLLPDVGWSRWISAATEKRPSALEGPLITTPPTAFCPHSERQQAEIRPTSIEVVWPVMAGIGVRGLSSTIL